MLRAVHCERLLRPGGRIGPGDAALQRLCRQLDNARGASVQQHGAPDGRGLRWLREPQRRVDHDRKRASAGGRLGRQRGAGAGPAPSPPTPATTHPGTRCRPRASARPGPAPDHPTVELPLDAGVPNYPPGVDAARDVLPPPWTAQARPARRRRPRGPRVAVSSADRRHRRGPWRCCCCFAAVVRIPPAALIRHGSRRERLREARSPMIARRWRESQSRSCVPSLLTAAKFSLFLMIAAGFGCQADSSGLPGPSAGGSGAGGSGGSKPPAARPGAAAVRAAAAARRRPPAAAAERRRPPAEQGGAAPAAARRQRRGDRRQRSGGLGGSAATDAKPADTTSPGSDAGPGATPEEDSPLPEDGERGRPGGAGPGAGRGHARRLPDRRRRRLRGADPHRQGDGRGAHPAARGEPAEGYRHQPAARDRRALHRARLRPVHHPVREHQTRPGDPLPGRGPGQRLLGAGRGAEGLHERLQQQPARPQRPRPRRPLRHRRRLEQLRHLQPHGVRHQHPHRPQLHPRHHRPAPDDPGLLRARPTTTSSRAPSSNTTCS